MDEIEAMKKGKNLLAKIDYSFGGDGNAILEVNVSWLIIALGNGIEITPSKLQNLDEFAKSLGFQSVRVYSEDWEWNLEATFPD